MKLVLVRHCEVIEEFQGKYNGHIDIPLSKKGLLDAKALGEKLGSYNFDAVYCSDLLRCRETLHQFHLQIPPIYTDLLREKSWGKHEGMSFEEIALSGIQYTSFEKWIKQLDGESVENFTQRVQTFFFHTLKRQHFKTVLIVSHSGVIKSFLAMKNNISILDAFSLEVPYGSFLEHEL